MKVTADVAKQQTENDMRMKGCESVYKGFEEMPYYGEVIMIGHVMQIRDREKIHEYFKDELSS